MEDQSLGNRPFGKTPRSLSCPLGDFQRIVAAFNSNAMPHFADFINQGCIRHSRASRLVIDERCLKIDFQFIAHNTEDYTTFPAASAICAAIPKSLTDYHATRTGPRKHSPSARRRTRTCTTCSSSFSRHLVDRECDCAVPADRARRTDAVLSASAPMSLISRRSSSSSAAETAQPFPARS